MLHWEEDHGAPLSDILEVPFLLLVLVLIPSFLCFLDIGDESLYISCQEGPLLSDLTCNYHLIALSFLMYFLRTPIKLSNSHPIPLYYFPHILQNLVTTSLANTIPSTGISFQLTSTKVLKIGLPSCVRSYLCSTYHQ